MPNDELKWRRRNEVQPGEIVSAALEMFAEKGFADAKLNDIARRAGISKGTLYLYFETKKELFRAVAQAAVKSHLDTIESRAEAFDGPFVELVPMLLSRAAEMMCGGQLPAIARMVIGEARKFPDLARIWHDDVVARVISTVSGIIARAQARGEVTPGDPRLHALSDGPDGDGHAVWRGLRWGRRPSARFAGARHPTRPHRATRPADAGGGGS
jgi:AcrR family transcriptional regulator